jgi:hypothetical protein
MASLVSTFTDCTKQKKVYSTIFEGLLMFVNDNSYEWVDSHFPLFGETSSTALRAGSATHLAWLFEVSRGQDP